MSEWSKAREASSPIREECLMLTEEELLAIEQACTGPDAKETYTAVVTEEVVLKMVQEIRRLRRETGRPH